MAEYLFNALTDGKHSTWSAGTKLSGPEQPLRELSLAESVILCMKEEGLDVSQHKRTQLRPEMVEHADKIIVMAEPETIPRYLSQSNKMTYWNVPDVGVSPTLEGDRDIRDQIKSLVQDLVKKFPLSE